ncbi:MAG: FtsX-like permease family protein [Thermoplasmata archaeon]|nr:MAG: FtsX-like permease family protein [Thermoplasmata archaeon]
MDTTSFCLSFLVVIIIVIIAALALTNRIIFKMALRNFTRRKVQSVIVIAGLMIGTAIISSSLVVRDTMINTFEVDVYRSLGEVDEEIWGTETWTNALYYKYFSESIYDSISRNLTKLPEIDGVAPVIDDNGAVFNLNTMLGEPSAALLGLDSSVMRESSFGDLDGNGYYTDSLAEDEIAINSRLAEDMDASVGDEVQLSYGAKDPDNPMGTSFMKKNFTVAKIILEEDLYGKANYNQRKTIFFELDTLQNLFNRPREINKIWISNKGDYREGEKYTSDVNQTIKEELDNAIGISDLGLDFHSFDGNLVLSSTTTGIFPLQQAGHLLEAAKNSNATVMKGLMVPAITLNNLPIFGLNVMGVVSNDPVGPQIEDNSIYFLESVATTYGITNGSSVEIVTMNLEGIQTQTELQVFILPTEFEGMMPDEIRAVTLGVVDFDTSQYMLHGGAYSELMASFVMVSGLDNVTMDQLKDSVTEEMNEDLDSTILNLEVHELKSDNVEAAREGGEGLGTLFMIFGMFSIIAGVVLIINIFVMLSEERKSEMGMARAVGMKGKHLVRMYIFEGSLYAFVAAIVGALLGLFFGWAIIYAFEYIFQSIEEFGEESFNIPFYFTWTSIFVAFSIGLFITFITIIFASTRISKLNIIRAIRRIPEPRPPRAKKRVIYSGIIVVIIGLFLISMAFSTEDGGYYLAGLPLVILGFSIIAHKWVSIRAAMTAAGLVILFFMFGPIEFSFMEDWDFSGMTSFVFSGVFSVLGAILVVMFNSNILLNGLQKIFGRGKSTRAVLKTAISYPMDNKFKTGMTLGMFALIIFTVTVIAMIASMQASQGDMMLEQQSGGYDIIGVTNPRTPFENLTLETLPPELQNKVDQIEVLSQSIVTIIDYDREEVHITTYGQPIDTAKIEQYQLIGVSESFMENNGYSLLEWDEERYETERDAWNALDDNSSLCIVDGTKLAFSGISVGSPPPDFGGVYIGSKIVITDMGGQNRTRELEVIGIMDQSFFINAIIIKKDVVKNEYGGVDSMFVAKLKSGEDADAVAKEFEKNYLEHGLQTFDMKGIINTILSLSNNIMYLMEGFLGIGLLVGIAGIGIISYRNVIERRQQIGMLRAIGFKKSMVTKSFLIETSFITILAIFLGIILGIGIGWQIYKDGFQDSGVGFVIPWANLLIISVIAYIATLIFTIYPSLKASKIPPAEALRYIE